MYKHLFALLIVSIGFCGQPSTQSTEGLVQNTAFESEINSLLSGTIPYMNVQELKNQLDQVNILDARELSEYKVSHIPGAKYVGFQKFKAKNLADLDRNKPVVVYCSIGYRSEKIGEKLKKAGFENVYNLYGSIFEWVNQGLEVVDENNLKTKQVHTYNRKWSKWVDNPEVEKIW